VSGQLGNGLGVGSLTPVTILSDVRNVSAGWDHVTALKTDGTVWTWGAYMWGGAYAGQGKLCTGATSNQLSPVQVPGITNAVQVSSGDAHTAILTANGTVFTCGSNAAGQLGNAQNADSGLPVQVVNLDSVVWITARDFHNNVIKSDGTVWSWGSGQQGELGNGLDWSNSNIPLQTKFA
jgi:alpha-tubulin suppressor-like RCC1 family protein